MIIIPVATPKGGAGKTTVSEMITAGCQLGGRRVVVLDCDAGNRGYLRRCGNRSAIEVSWSVDPASVHDFIAAHLTDIDVVVLDFGANLLASATSILEFLAALFQRLRSDGATVLTVAVASPNAPGTGQLIETISRNFGALGQTVVVENDADGSGAFPPRLDELGIPRVRLGPLAPGIIAARLCRAEPLANVLLKPTLGHDRAMATYAYRMLLLLKQPPLVDLVGERALACLEGLSQRAALAINYRVDTLAQAHDDVIALNEQFYWALRKLDSCSEAEAWPALAAYRDAKAGYIAARTK